MMSNLMHGMQQQKAKLNLTVGIDTNKSNRKEKIHLDFAALDLAVLELKPLNAIFLAAQETIQKVKLKELIAAKKKEEKELKDKLKRREKGINDMLRESWFYTEVRQIQIDLQKNKITQDLLTHYASEQPEQEDNQEKDMPYAIEEGDLVKVVRYIENIAEQKKTRKIDIINEFIGLVTRHTLKVMVSKKDFPLTSPALKGKVLYGVLIKNQQKKNQQQQYNHVKEKEKTLVTLRKQDPDEEKLYRAIIICELFDECSDES